ncbi:MAG: hypothetical protein MPJ25_14905, partial [Pirellulales bacterium]|nr:hypothetical protein [Pirellulales bacterium]
MARQPGVTPAAPLSIDATIAVAVASADNGRPCDQLALSPATRFSQNSDLVGPSTATFTSMPRDANSGRTAAAKPWIAAFAAAYAPVSYTHL